VSPLARFPAPKFAPLTNTLAQDFANARSRHSRSATAKAVWDDTRAGLYRKRTVFPNPGRITSTCSATSRQASRPGSTRTSGIYTSYAAYYVRGKPAHQVVNPIRDFIRLWQRYIWLPATGYGLILLVGLGGLVVAWRGSGRGAAALGDLRGPLVTPAATAEFDTRTCFPRCRLPAWRRRWRSGRIPWRAMVGGGGRRSAVAGASDAEHDLARTVPDRFGPLRFAQMRGQGWRWASGQRRPGLGPSAGIRAAACVPPGGADAGQHAVGWLGPLLVTAFGTFCG